MLGALAVVVAVGVLVGSNLATSFSYLKRPSEMKTMTAEELTHHLRLGGVVMPNSIKKTPNTQLKEFALFEKDTVVLVRFNGNLPDLFQENKPAVVEGYWKDGVLEADNVLAKHDENYVPREMKGSSMPAVLTSPPLGPETMGMVFKGPK